MLRRQTSPDQWLLITSANAKDAANMARRLPRGTGIILLSPLPARVMRTLRQLAIARDLTIVAERPGIAARVHNARELRRALTSGTRLVLLSPMFETATHPDWRPLPRMRAAALARLGGRKLIALGGMNAWRYARVARLGFSGWAGMSAFRT